MSITDLRNYNVSGGFNETLWNRLQNDSVLCFEIIQNLLNAHFPPSIHDDILQAIDIELPPPTIDPRRRPSNFRRDILRAYEYRCAICGFDVRLGNSPVALEAAHIQWHMAGGPDVTVNGLALCSLHHKLFDRGVFTLSRELHILVSDEAHGTTGFQEWVMDFHEQIINLPQRRSYYPEEDFISWHVREVFQGDYRES
ncbi:MAG: HNH endonuclease [Candidatus Poribacteria bacterium]|nr:HNH endonuclease [Candidatus Poribacteria bacterium]